MADDLYEEWLRIPVKDRRAGATPNAYDLLGLPRFCHHPAAAEEAARRRLETLDKFSLHPEKVKRDMASRMMNEVAQARLVVSDAARYRAYDPQLAKALKIEVPEKEVPAPPDLLPLSEGGVRLDMGEAAGRAMDQGDIKPLDTSLLGADAPAIKAEADLTAPREKGLGESVPKGVIIGGVAAGVLIAILLGVLLLTGGSNEEAPAPGAQVPPSMVPSDPAAPGAAASNAGTSAPVAPRPAAAPVDRPETLDEYDRPMLGRDRYEVRLGDGAAAEIENEQLVLRVTDVAESEIRLKFTPSSDERPLRKLQLKALVEGEQTSLVVAIASGALRLVLTRTGNEVEVTAAPGTPPLDGWRRVDMTDGKPLEITAERKQGTVVWSVNGELAATSPEIAPRGTPTVTFTFVGYRHASAVIDDLAVWRVQDKQP